MRRFAETYCSKEGVGSKDETKEYVYHNNEADIGLREKQKMPSEGDNDPSGEICQRNGNMP